MGAVRKVQTMFARSADRFLIEAEIKTHRVSWRSHHGLSSATRSLARDCRNGQSEFAHGEIRARQD